MLFAPAPRPDGQEVDVHRLGRRDAGGVAHEEQPARLAGQGPESRLGRHQRAVVVQIDVARAVRDRVTD